MARVATQPAVAETSPGTGRRAARELGYLVSTSLGARMAFDGAMALAALVAGDQAGPLVRAWLTAEAVRAGPPPSLLLFVVFPVAFVAAGLATGLYERRTRRTPWTALVPASLAATLAGGATILVAYFVTYAPIGRWRVVLAGLFAALAAFLPRFLLYRWGTQAPRRILFVGGETGLRALETAIEAGSHGELLLAASYLGPEAEALEVSDLVPACDRARADLVVLQAGVPQPVLAGTAACLEAGIPIWDLVTFFGRSFHRVPIECVDLAWTVETSSTQNPSLTQVAKRLSDLVLASLGLLLSLPAWPLIALGIKLTSAGPVFHVQERTGWRGRTFRIYKFRSMTVDAEAPDSPVWAQDADVRVTSFGRFLRWTRLDEVPQFLNVLRGDMSFVGPRPERPTLVEELAAAIPHFRLRHLVKPGITGWAQIHLPYAASVEETSAKLSYDLFYVKHQSFLLDLRILVRTFAAVLRGGR